MIGPASGAWRGASPGALSSSPECDWSLWTASIAQKPNPENTVMPGELTVTTRLRPLDIRIPKWDHDDLIMRDCPVCAATDSALVCERPDSLSVRECRNCRLNFVSPAPSHVQLQAFYSDYDENHRRSERTSVEELAESYADADPFAALYVRELKSLMDFEGARVLDVGFGRAALLINLQRLGSEPFGIELDEQAIMLARSLGLQNVFHGDISEYTSEKKFDLITLLDLVEHPLEPMDLLKRTADLLQEGGLMLVWTPNGAYSRRDSAYTTYRVDLEHMQYFTPETCSFIASELQLQIVHLETVGFPGLEGIDKLRRDVKPRVRARATRSLIKAVPGMRFINRARRKFMTNEPDQRRGSFNLFCIMQKPQ